MRNSQKFSQSDSHLSISIVFGLRPSENQVVRDFADGFCQNLCRSKTVRTCESRIAQADGIIRTHGQAFSYGFVGVVSPHGEDGHASTQLLLQENGLFNRISVPFVEVEDKATFIDIFS